MSDEDVKRWLGEDAKLFNYETATIPGKGPYIIIKTKQFLPTEIFARVIKNVEKHGGEYVSAGKNSHFRIPTKDTPQTDSQLAEIIDEFERVLTKLRRLVY
jgi:hypothetical protein